MRVILAAALLAGCVVQHQYPPYGDDDGWSPPPPGAYGCTQDSECSDPDLVCTRTHECLPTDQVRAVHVLWTVGGQTASANTCTTTPDLGVEFIDDTGYHFGYAPVPCMEGRFNVDKMPTRFATAELGVHDGPGWTDEIIDPETGNAQFDIVSQ